MRFTLTKGERYWAGGAIGAGFIFIHFTVLHIMKQALNLRLDPNPWIEVVYKSDFYVPSIAIGFIAIASFLSSSILIIALIKISRQGKMQSRTAIIGCLTGMIAGYLFVTFLAAMTKIPNHHPDSETKQNLISIGLALERYFDDYGFYPVDLMASPSLQSEGYLTEYPRTSFKRIRKTVKELKAANQEFFATDPRPAIGETGRFGQEGMSVVNLCMGYELGADLFPWWDAYPFRWNENYEKKKRRMVCAGNFVYIPLDAGGNPIRYDDKSEDKAADYFLTAFAYPNVNGKDVWTPSGNPDAPVTLTPDGIPDGVIFVMRAGEEIR